MVGANRIMLDLFSYIDSGSALLPASSLVDFKLFDPKEKKHLRVHGRLAPLTFGSFYRGFTGEVGERMSGSPMSTADFKHTSRK